MEQPAWLATAWAEFGVLEAEGGASNARVVAYFADAGHGEIDDDATPWCAAFAGAMLKRAGVPGTGSLLARSYLSWGEGLEAPRLGAVTVLTRGEDPGAGHVGFFLGAAGDRIFLLGGNQGDGVSVAAFEQSRLIGYRWPETVATEAERAAPGAFDRALAHVLKMEGGFSDDPYDPGGPTNRGITLDVFARWMGETVDAISRPRLVEALKRIPDDAVRDIYRARYWQPSACPQFTPPLAFMHFDASVNHGVTGAARLLQAAAGVTVDGEIGPETLKALASRPVRDLLDSYAELRRKRYRALPHFWRFGRGWLNRVESTLAGARALADETGVAAGLAEPQQSAKGERTMEESDNGSAETAAKWWLQSKTVWGTLITAAATVIPLIGPLIGVEVPSEVIRQAGDQTVTAVQAVAGLFGTLLAIYGRFKAASPLGLQSDKSAV